MDASALIAEFAIVAVPLLASVVCHEVAHGAVALACGDDTARRAGRLTLNPVPHIDPVGTLLLPGLLLLAPLVLGSRPFLFGYARPVPVDPRRFRRPRRDAVLVALAGPGTNLVLAAASALALGALPAVQGGVLAGLALMAAASIRVNCLLAVFNMLPVPPLDGGRVVTALLPHRSARLVQAVESVGIVLVLLVVLNTQVLGLLVNPLVRFFLGIAQ